MHTSRPSTAPQYVNLFPVPGQCTRRFSLQSLGESGQVGRFRLHEEPSPTLTDTALTKRPLEGKMAWGKGPEKRASESRAILDRNQSEAAGYDIGSVRKTSSRGGEKIF